MSGLRAFYIVSFISMIGLFVALGIYGRDYVENGIIRKMAHQINEMSGENFVQDYWEPNEKTLLRLPCSIPPCPDTFNLRNAFIDYFSKQPVLRATLYSSSEGGESLFPPRHFVVDENLRDSRLLDSFSEARKGHISSTFIANYSFGMDTLNIVRSFYPILHNGHTVAVLEVLYDATPIWKNQATVQAVMVVAIICFFLVILCVNYLSSYRTEKLISKQYETNLELASEKNLAEAENSAKSQFLANISHELRTPLNAIIGFSEIIKDEVMGPLGNRQYKDYILDIHVSGVHLLSLINDILDYSKAEAGKLSVTMEDMDATKIMKNSLRLVLPRAQEAGLKLLSNIPVEHHILYTDGKRLKQVLLNLLSNAVKFTEEGGMVTLSAWSSIPDDSFKIEVRDTGVGIAPKDISKVMSTFGQVENRLSRKYEGTGLGLPLSKKLVELMGGKFEIESQPGEGTAIIISLPYIDPRTRKQSLTNVDNEEPTA